MRETDTEHARAILDAVIYPTVTTVDENNQPWAAPQFTAYDPTTKTLYWCADSQSQHAQNIAHNAQVYIVAYDSMAAPGAGDGVYVRAEAEIVTNEHEQDTAFTLLLKKHAGVPYWSIADIRAADSPVKLFKAHATSAWVNKDRLQNGHFVLYRQAVTL